MYTSGLAYQTPHLARLHRPNFTHVILDPFAFVNLKSGVGSVRTECSGKPGQREMLLSLVTSNYGSIR